MGPLCVLGGWLDYSCARMCKRLRGRRALIRQGYTPEQAERHLIAESADTGMGRHAVGLRILAGLNAR